MLACLLARRTPSNEARRGRKKRALGAAAGRILFAPPTPTPTACLPASPPGTAGRSFPPRAGDVTRPGQPPGGGVRGRTTFSLPGSPAELPAGAEAVALLEGLRQHRRPNLRQKAAAPRLTRRAAAPRAARRGRGRRRRRGFLLRTHGERQAVALAGRRTDGGTDAVRSATSQPSSSESTRLSAARAPLTGSRRGAQAPPSALPCPAQPNRASPAGRGLWPSGFFGPVGQRPLPAWLSWRAHSRHLRPGQSLDEAACLSDSDRDSGLPPAFVQRGLLNHRDIKSLSPFHLLHKMP